MATNWQRKDVWSREGEHFGVEVSRHERHSIFKDEGGPHRWCVYAYIREKHPHFAKFDASESMFQPATRLMPLHGGCSLITAYREPSGRPCCWRVGADYNHIDDTRFTHYATAEDAAKVFRDADELFAWLEAIGKGETPAPAQTLVSPIQALDLMMNADTLDRALSLSQEVES